MTEEEIGSLRLTTLVPKILLEAHLTASTTGLSVGGGGDTRHGMSPFNTIKSGVYDARGVRLVNDVLQIPGNMAGTGRTGAGMKLTGIFTEIFPLAKSTMVLPLVY